MPVRHATGTCGPLLRRALAVVLIPAAQAACAFDRKRPEPVETDDPASLVVELLEPENGTMVVAGRSQPVRVSARDIDGENLAGVGFLVRRFNSGRSVTVDSAAATFARTDQVIREFDFTVPASLSASTQLDIYGIAYGPGAQASLSTPRFVVVASCPPGQSSC